jgi:pilus assembly protein Flp/PilA
MPIPYRLATLVRQLSDRLDAIRRHPASDEQGQGMVEYALILVLIAVVVIVILTVVGNQVSNVFSNVSGGLNQ